VNYLTYAFVVYIQQREKTSQAFRDALQGQYKSSNTQKKKRRWMDPDKTIERQNSAPLLSVSSIRESLEDDVVGSDGHDSNSFHLEDSDEFEYNSPTVRAFRPELMNKLCKQHSAPSLYHSYAGKYDNSGLLTLETAQSLTGSSRSLFAYSESSDDSSRVLSSGFDAEIRKAPLNDASNSRRSFLGFNRHKSMRSVVEEAEQVNLPTDWFNRSCPNMASSVSRPKSFLPPIQSSDLEPFPVFLTEYSNQNAPVVGSSNNMLDDLATPTESPTKGSPNELNITEQYLKMKTSHEDFLLSPIGDGSVDGLFEILEGMEVDGNDKTRDLFEPLPF
jgi:hypothetical protein